MIFLRKLTHFICVGLAMATTLSITGCNENDPPRLQGHYVGGLTIDGIQTQVTAEIPEFEVKAYKSKINSRELKRYVLHFNLKSVQTDVVQSVQITFDNGAIQIKMNPYMNTTPLQLEREPYCASGLANGKQSIRLCWTRETLEFEHWSANTKTPSLPGKLLAGLVLRRQNATIEASTLNWEQAVALAKVQTFREVQESERVYRAQLDVTTARMNMVPRFSLRILINLWEGYSIADAVASYLPFLFPSNWYQLAEKKALSRAEQLTYAALKQNELNMVETLYIALERDQRLLELLKEKNTELFHYLTEIQAQRSIGWVDDSTVELIKSILNAHQKDTRLLADFLKIERTQLAQMLAFSPIHTIANVESLPEFGTAINAEKQEAPDADQFSVTAQVQSFEVRALREMLLAAHKASDEKLFSILNPWELVAIDFTYPSAVKYKVSQEREMSNRIEETLGLIEQKSVMVATDLKQAIEKHKEAKLNETTRKRNYLMQLERGEFDTVSLQTLLSFQDAWYGSRAEIIAAEAAVRIAWSNLRRLRGD